MNTEPVVRSAWDNPENSKDPLDADDKTPGNSVHDQTRMANCTLDCQARGSRMSVQFVIISAAVTFELPLMFLYIRFSSPESRRFKS
jgi:hypothetical protein